MRFFNIDLHSSVITDVKTCLRAAGHLVESHNMSGHTWALGISRASKGIGPGSRSIGYGSINVDNWESLFHDWPSYARAAAWRDENRKELERFDGFISCYPPAFALLYEGLPGKNIIDIPVRYDLHFTERPTAWRDFNDRLRRQIDEGKLVAVANSRYDAAYFEYFVGRPCRYISSTCEYVDGLTGPWSPGTPLASRRFIGFGEHSGCREAADHDRSLRFVRDLFPHNYNHEQITRASGLVWIPYNCSIMSFFEHYWLGIPLFVPSERFLVELWDKGLALSQLSWHRSLYLGSNIEPYLCRPSCLDPHTRDGVLNWMQFYDFYNRAEFPDIVYFDSWKQMAEVLAESDLENISAAMGATNKVRRKKNLEAWVEVVKP
jgi:hypothetical protein